MEEQSVQCATKLITLANETSFSTQELQVFDATDSPLSCVRVIDSAVRFGRIDTAPVDSLTAASSEALTLQRRNCLRVSIGLALCGTRKMRRTPMRARAEQPAPTRAWSSVTAREVTLPAATTGQHRLGTTVGFFQLWPASSQLSSCAWPSL